MFKDDPNYKEVSRDVDMYVEKSIQNPPRLFQRMINAICLAFKNIYGKIYNKEIKKVCKPEIIYKDEPVDLKYVHVKDLNDENIRGLGTSSGIYYVRNRKTGSVTITNGNAKSIKSQFNEDYEIIEAAIKD